MLLLVFFFYFLFRFLYEGQNIILHHRCILEATTPSINYFHFLVIPFSLLVSHVASQRNEFYMTWHVMMINTKTEQANDTGNVYHKIRLLLRHLVCCLNFLPIYYDNLNYLRYTLISIILKNINYQCAEMQLIQ